MGADTSAMDAWQLWFNRAGFVVVAALAAETLYWLIFFVRQQRRAPRDTGRPLHHS